MRRATKTVLGGSAAAAVTGVLGFVVRPRRPKACRSDAATHVPELVALDPALPELLRAHLDIDGDGLVPRTDALELCLHGRMRIGPGLSLPVLMGTSRDRHQFASDLSITWWGGRVINGLDAYVAGHGISRIGPRIEVGMEIDQGANLFFWAEALAVPSLFAAGTPVKAVQTGEDEVRLTLPFGHGTDEAEISFDGPAPVRFSALRHRGVGKPKERWHVDYSDWQDVHGLPVPERVSVTWADDGAPWLRLQVDAATPGVDVTERLGLASTALHQARTAAGLEP